MTRRGAARWGRPHFFFQTAATAIKASIQAPSYDALVNPTGRAVLRSRSQRPSPTSSERAIAPDQEPGARAARPPRAEEGGAARA
jgi:hypothetical protein